MNKERMRNEVYSLFQPISNVFRGGSIILIVMQEFPLPFWKKNKMINHKLADKIQSNTNNFIMNKQNIFTNIRWTEF